MQAFNTCLKAATRHAQKASRRCFCPEDHHKGTHTLLLCTKPLQTLLKQYFARHYTSFSSRMKEARITPHIGIAGTASPAELPQPAALTPRLRALGSAGGVEPGHNPRPGYAPGRRLRDILLPSPRPAPASASEAQCLSPGGLRGAFAGHGSEPSARAPWQSPTDPPRPAPRRAHRNLATPGPARLPKMALPRPPLQVSCRYPEGVCSDSATGRPISADTGPSSGLCGAEWLHREAAEQLPSAHVAVARSAHASWRALYAPPPSLHPRICPRLCGPPSAYRDPQHPAGLSGTPPLILDPLRNHSPAPKPAPGPGHAGDPADPGPGRMRIDPRVAMAAEPRVAMDAAHATLRTRRIPSSAGCSLLPPCGYAQGLLPDIRRQGRRAQGTAASSSLHLYYL